MEEPDLRIFYGNCCHLLAMPFENFVFLPQSRGGQIPTATATASGGGSGAVAVAVEAEAVAVAVAGCLVLYCVPAYLVSGTHHEYVLCFQLEQGFRFRQFFIGNPFSKL